MDEIISYKMCAVKVRNAKLRNYLKQKFVLRITFCITFCITHRSGNHFPLVI
jgi:hypothetical protein